MVLTFGRAGVGSADVLTTAMLGEGAPAVDVKPPILWVLLYRATEVEEEGGVG